MRHTCPSPHGAPRRAASLAAAGTKGGSVDRGRRQRENCMMKRLLLALLMLFAAAAAPAAAPHYVMQAKFDPQGNLRADVVVTLTEALPQKAFLLSKRFTLAPMKLPRGVTMTREDSA